MWVFAYGSLMWNPGFDYIERYRGRLQGYHRSMCIYSWVYRGTKEVPGLVLGLEAGAWCDGVCFRVDEKDREAVRAYLDARELPTGVYTATMGPVDLQDDAGVAIDRQVSALAYVTIQDHVQYAGPLAEDERAALIRQGHGKGGSAIDYLDNSMRELEAMNIQEPALASLHRRVHEL